ncbi:hypothetical protein FGF1_03570 [Flavobacteriaceae bacterium GF1]
MAAPKGNKFAEGNEGGRPPIHTDPKAVETLIQDYFEWIQGEQEEKEVTEQVHTEDGTKEVKKKVMEWVRMPEPPTVTGLTLHLGFADKSTLYDYKKKDEFSHSIKSAISRIEKFHEIAIAQGDKCTGNIFALKNFGWKDKSEVDHNIKTEQPLFPD